MRVSAVAAAMILSACSVAGMKRVSPDWDGSSAPECTDGYAWIVGDGAAAGLAAAATVIALERPDEWAGLAAPAAVLVLGFAVSGILGEDMRSDCRAARIAWQAGAASRARSDK